MDTLPTNNIILLNGEYPLSKSTLAGRQFSVEATGTFDGATVQVGFVSTDATPIFVADNNAADSFYAVPKTAAGRWLSFKSASGIPAVKVTGAGAATAIKVAVVRVY